MERRQRSCQYFRRRCELEEAVDAEIYDIKYNSKFINMLTPSEHKTVQARILEYAEAIGWTMVSREEAERRRGFDPHAPLKERARGCSLFFDNVLEAKVREFNRVMPRPRAPLLGKFRNFHANIDGNREFVEHLRNRGKFFDHEEQRERDLILVDYDEPTRNVF